MTCAHVVNVALKKVPGVETVDVSLNKALATVKLKPGNTVSVPDLWQLLHQKGYTPKATTVSVRGQVAGGPGRFQLKVSGTNDILDLAPDQAGGGESVLRLLLNKGGQIVVIQGVMVPGKDLKALVPLQVSQVK
ncbi:MAG TPA: heavy metal-associated domain-containing protein [Bryobacteraceae bacterium]|jgi:copper chaperone CopZ|nr:heavy metal-associated domain-containing protein [Bryobacteraceae bacterium]